MIAVGLTVGMISGLLGVGGGVLMTPILHLFGMSIPMAVGTTLTQMIASSSSGTYKHWRNGNISWPIVFCFAIPGLIGVFFGKSLLVFVSAGGDGQAYLSLVYAGFLLVMALAIARRELRSQSSRPLPEAPRKTLSKFWGPTIRLSSLERELAVLPFIVFGFAIGVISGMTGLGGGFFYMPIMVYFFGLAASVAVGSSLAIVVATSITGAASFNSQGLVDLKIAMLLACGSIVGAYLGATISGLVQGPRLKLYFAGLVFAAGVATALRYFEQQSLAIGLLFLAALFVLLASFFDSFLNRSNRT